MEELTKMQAEGYVATKATCSDIEILARIILTEGKVREDFEQFYNNSLHKTRGVNYTKLSYTLNQLIKKWFSQEDIHNALFTFLTKNTNYCIDSDTIGCGASHFFRRTATQKSIRPEYMHEDFKMPEKKPRSRNNSNTGV